MAVYMRHNKCAVFQVTNNQGVAHLICVPGASFGDGARFETELREYCGTCLDVRFLGRFDEIRSAAGFGEVLDLLLRGSASPLLTLSGPLSRHTRLQP